MRESERRIRAYQAVLPRMKERVIAAVSLLAVALTTMVSATYAWFVLSQNPEVTGLQTTIAANGNLEIALAGRMDEVTGKMLSPAESTVIDGTLPLTEKNLTWGNLVNLGDPSYALDNIVLRPAQLNEEKGALLTSPLYAATYGADGRVEQLLSNFGYTYVYSDGEGSAFLTEDEIIKKLTEVNPDKPAIFKKYGVRAVSSTKVSYNSDYSKVFAEKLSAAASSIVVAQNAMDALDDHEGIPVLLALAGRYLGAEVADMTGGNPRNTAVEDAELDALVNLFNALLEVCDLSADALAELYKAEAYMRTEKDLVVVTGSDLLDLSLSWDALMDKLSISAEEYGGKDESLIQISEDAKTQLLLLRSNYQKLLNSRDNISASKGQKVRYAKVVAEEGAIYIDQWLAPVFDINSVTINGETIDQITARVSEALGDRSFSALLAGAGTAINILNSVKNRPEVIITRGILPDVHKFVGVGVDNRYSFEAPTDGSSLESMIGNPIKITDAHIQTKAAEPYALIEERDRVKNSTTAYKGSTAQAAETYGLVLDFWVRTNVSDSKLTLEGAPVYTTHETPVVVTINGAEKALYKLTVCINDKQELDTNGYEVECEAYIHEQQYYLYDRSDPSLNQVIGPVDSPAIKKSDPVIDSSSELIGYNGVNRVWDDMISDPNSAYDYSNSTTMGSGSCYVFYPKSADDQEKAIQLLKNLCVAFISEDGELFGTGVLDTEHAIEQAGKVTVPLVCHYENAFMTRINDNGEEERIYYITDLEANTPTLVTALVYLDGTELSNDQVLSTNDIQGHLNIQFGTTADLSAMEDPVLREERCTVTATMTDGAGVQTLTSQKITDDASLRTKYIEIKVEGVTPSRVTAYFQRKLNDTQGIRQNEIVFNDDDGDGTWIATYEFVNAGNYILRDVLVDGVTYELDQENPIEYTLTGYAIHSLVFEGGSTASETYGLLTNGSTYVTTEQRFNADVALNFTREGNAPTSIRGAFIHQETGNRVTVSFRRDGSLWRGSVAFTTTGVYRLERLEIDGDPMSVPANQMLSLDLYLGVTANVYSNKTEIGLNDETPTGKVNMSMTVVADNDAQFTNLPPVTLIYSKNGSSTDDNTLRAPLVWNNQSKSYQGEFEITSSGTYTFLRAEMTINGNLNVLKRARTAPTLKVTKADDIPTFVTHKNLGADVFSMNNDASFSITLKKAGPATVDAKILDAAGNAYYVRGGHMERKADGTEEFVDTPAVTKDAEGVELFTFTFYLPKVGADLSQSGTWMLEELYFTGIFDNAGTFYNASTDNGPLPADDPALGDRDPYTVSEWYYNRWWTWTQADIFEGEADAFTVTVTDSIELSVVPGQNTMYPGGTADNITGLFGAEFTPDGIRVNLTAGGQPLGDNMTIEDISLTYQIDNQASFATTGATTTSKLGGYSFATTANGVNQKDKLVNLLNNEFKFGGSGNVVDEGNGVYLLKPNGKLYAAGIYTVKALTAKITSGDQVRDVPDGKVVGAPNIVLYTQKPTATITGVSGSPSKQEKITYTGGACSSSAPTFAVETDNNSATSGVDSANNKAVLYGDASADNSTQRNGTFAQPTLTVTIAGVSSDCTTSFILPANGNATAITFSRTGNGTISNKIGSTKQIKSWTTSLILNHKLNAYYGHGTQSIDQLTVTQNGITFTFTLDQPMTIVNPSSVNQS